MLSVPDVVTGMFKVFSLDVETLFYMVATLYYVTPLIGKKLRFCPTFYMNLS